MPYRDFPIKAGAAVFLILALAIIFMIKGTSIVPIPLGDEITDNREGTRDQWRTFVNQDLGFSVEYPVGYQASGDAINPLSIVPDPAETASFSVLTAVKVDGNTETAIEYLRKDYFVQLIDRFPYNPYVRVTVSPRDNSSVEYKVFVLSNGAVSYVLSGWHGGEYWAPTEEVAGTFRFID